MGSVCANDSNQDYEISDPAVFAARPVVSVTMLAYNHGDYVEQAIEGVLAQANACPLELLIGEDCSTDTTREIAVRYQKRYPNIVRVITADTNVGAMANSRRVLAATRGDFIAHLDGDDYWLPGKLARQLAFLAQNPGCAAVYTNALTIDRHGNRIGLFNDVGDARFDLAGMLQHGNFLNNSSKLYRASEKAALLEINEPYLDYQAHLVLARYGSLAQLGEPLAVYRVNSSSSMLGNASDHVRALYWQAILSVPRNLVSDRAYAWGVADFLKRLTFRAARTRELHLLQVWAPRAFKESPFGTVRTGLLVVVSILRMLAKLVAGRFHRGEDGRRRPILYRR